MMETVIQVLRAITCGAVVVFIIHVIDYTITSKKLRVKKVKELEEKMKEMEEKHNFLINLSSKPFLSIEDAKIRDFFIRTNYVGRLTNKELVNEFKNSLGITFEDFKQEVFNYNVKHLKRYYKLYKNYEHKQIVLDSYKDKNKEAK